MAVKQQSEDSYGEGIDLNPCWPVRVIFSENYIRKVAFNTRPTSMGTLLSELKEKLDLQYDFIVQYEDPEFNNALCNLTHPSELPNRPTLKIVSSETITSSVSTASSVHGSIDTSILPSPSEGMRVASRAQWPTVFDIPEFSAETENRLRQGNLVYLRDGTPMDLSRDLKHDVLEKLAEAMYQFKAYPHNEQFSAVAEALISKHPCLREPGSSVGWYGWKNSLKFKMGNFRSKLRKAGMAEVFINGKRKSKKNPEGEPSSKNIKRPRRSEANFLPNFPDGQDASTLEASRQNLENEVKKRSPDLTLVQKMMDQTFSLRRKEIVEEQLSVRTMKQRWPALLNECQIFAEFHRIAAKNLQQDFFESLDIHTPRLMEMFKCKRGVLGHRLKVFLEQINAQAKDVTAERTLVLRVLPILLGDDDSEFLLWCFDTDPSDDFTQVPIGILMVMPENACYLGTNQLHHQMTSIAIILEGDIVLDNVESYPKAMCLVFGLMYVLHIDYPAGMRNTFHFVQKMLLQLGEGKLSPKLLALKNSLLA